jgi:hypothetical protein
LGPRKARIGEDIGQGLMSAMERAEREIILVKSRIKDQQNREKEV